MTDYPKSKFFPRDRRLSVQEQADLDDHARNMWKYMNDKVEEEKLTALREEVRVEEKKFRRTMRKQKRALKKAARKASADSGYSSGSSSSAANSRPVSQVPVPAGLVPNPFYQGPPMTPTPARVYSPTGVLLVPNPFFVGSTPSTSPPASCKPIQLIRNPFYDPTFASKMCK